MSQLCKDLTLNIWKERDPEGGPNSKRVKIHLANQEGLDIEVYYGINSTAPRSSPYHIREAVVIALRRVVSEAFQKGLITESLTDRSLSSGHHFDETPR